MVKINIYGLVAIALAVVCYSCGGQRGGRSSSTIGLMKDATMGLMQKIITDDTPLGEIPLSEATKGTISLTTAVESFYFRNRINAECKDASIDNKSEATANFCLFSTKDNQAITDSGFSLNGPRVWQYFNKIPASLNRYLILEFDNDSSYYSIKYYGATTRLSKFIPYAGYYGGYYDYTTRVYIYLPQAINLMDATTSLYQDTTFNTGGFNWLYPKAGQDVQIQGNIYEGYHQEKINFNYYYTFQAKADQLTKALCAYKKLVLDYLANNPGAFTNPYPAVDKDKDVCEKQ